MILALEGQVSDQWGQQGSSSLNGHYSENRFELDCRALPLGLTLKWTNREEGYIKNVPTGSSIIMFSSHITSQGRYCLIGFSEA